MTGPGIYSQVYHRTPCPAVPVSRSHHNGQLENALQKHCFVYSALIVGTLKGFTGRFFNFSAQSQNFAGGLTGPDSP